MTKTCPKAIGVSSLCLQSAPAITRLMGDALIIKLILLKRFVIYFQELTELSSIDVCKESNANNGKENARIGGKHATGWHSKLLTRRRNRK